MAFSINNLGLVSLLASAALAAPSYHIHHRHQHRQVTDVVTDVAVVTQYVYATAPAAAATPSAAAVQPAAVAPEAAAPAGNDLNWDYFQDAESSSAAPAPIAAVSTPAPVQVQTPVVKQPKPATTLATRVSSVHVVSSSTATPSATPSSAPSNGSGGKRGVAYNTASLTDLFTSSAFGWAYNWASSASGNIPSALEYVPMLWSSRADFTGGWNSAADSALASGSTHILGFNEPDHTEQANMSPGDAVTAWNQYLEPYAGKAKLVSPAVTNGAAPMGLAWLGEFLDGCSGCSIDAVAIHWYDSATNVEYFKQHITEAHTQTGKPVWVTEFGASGSDDQISDFLSQVLPWLDAQDFVERYAYFMAADGQLLSGGALSTYGKTYVDTA